MSPRGGWLNLALAGATGFLVGVLVVAALGGAKGVTTTVRAPLGTVAAVGVNTTTSGGTVVVKTAVPELVGSRLDVARQRLDSARFDAEINGGGLFGVVDDTNWQVTGQDPPSGTILEQGSTVRVDVERG